MIFLGIDLGWMSQPSGVARLSWDGLALHLEVTDRLAHHSDVIDWVAHHVGDSPAMIAVDAPLVIPNATGIRTCERLVNAQYRRFDAGCHAVNQGRPFYPAISSFVAGLSNQGFHHAPQITPQTPGRYMIEVHPHAAHVNMFLLDRIIKYKKGTVAQRRQELERYRDQLATFIASELPVIPTSGNLKPVEDRLDAVLSAYVGARWYLWGNEWSSVYGDESSGYIVIPNREPKDPIHLFAEWMKAAESTGMRDPNAMTLATVDDTGQPDARMVLLKSFDHAGFVFFTNYRSRKARELTSAPKAALVFHWRELDRQIRITGRVEKAAPEEADQYFATRARLSQIGAWASQQSETLEHREQLESAVLEREAEFADRDVPRPPHWGGYRVVPHEIEFWQGHRNRLHTREVFTRQPDGVWTSRLLWP